ncbi:MAG: alpha/beta fold hydrolase [Gammaproteobacteria bacterium]
MLTIIKTYWGRIILGLGLFGLVLAWHVLPETSYRVVIALERAHAGLYQAEVEVAGAPVIYLDGGQGDVLLLLHGFGANKDNWTRVARFLTPHYRVIAPDLPGFGDSELAQGADYSIPAQVGRLRAFVEALGLGSVPINLGGSSMGGNIAGAYAARFPDQVQSLWLIAPLGVAGARPSEVDALINAGEGSPLMIERQREFDRLLEYVFEERPWIPHPVREYLSSQAAARYHHYHWIHDQIRIQGAGGTRPATPLQPLLTGLDLPTLIVWGEEDRVLDPSGAALLAAVLPASELQILPGIGHLPMLERPEETAERYLQFLGEIAAARADEETP